jgi:hypothetical protein
MRDPGIHYTLLYAGTPIGVVPLPSVPLSAGWLWPTDAYATIRPIIQWACAAAAGAGFRTDTAEVALLWEALQRVTAQLQLRTEAGYWMHTEMIDIWHDPRRRERPFVLVRFAESPSIG